MNEPKANTHDALLDAAEHLFGCCGVHRTSLRTVTREAGANLAAVHYHFGSKEGLLREVLARRLRPLNSQRLEMLDVAEEAGGGTAPLDEIINAFVQPTLQMLQRVRGGHAFARLLSRALSEPDDKIRDLVMQEFVEIADRFPKALCRALPHLDPVEVYWRFHFMIGAMAHTVGFGFIVHKMSHGLCDPLDIEAVNERLVRFLVAGFESEVVEEIDA